MKAGTLDECVSDKALRLTAELDGKQGDEDQHLDESRESLVRERHHATVS
jgi:hypothetical protein